MRLRKFWVNASPKHFCGRYDARFDNGLTVSVDATSPRNAIKVAKATGFHTGDDYPKNTTFDFTAHEG